MEFKETGIVYRASRRAYIGNYFLAALLAIFFFIAYNRFVYPVYGITFTLFPKVIDQMIPTITILGMLAVIALLFDEPILEGIIRKYIVRNDEVIIVEGILRKKRTIMPYGSVANVTTRKSVFGRIFNYGDLVIDGFKDTIIMKAMVNPDSIQRIMQNKISLLRQQALKKKDPAKKEE